MTSEMARGGGLFGALLVIVMTGACSDGESSGHSHEELAPDCEALMHACHLVDIGEGEVHECHEVAHHNQSADCTSRRDSCVGVCGAASDAGQD
jgi:hypothetical protein